MPQFAALGAEVYALSYDEPDALLDFQRAHNITYHLLSDPDSQVIREFGILNTLIAEDDHPWFGIPYPGTYVVDSAGVITHKFFENNLAVRAGPEQMLRALRGENVTSPTPTTASDGDTEAQEQVQVEVSLEGEYLSPTVQRDLVIRCHVPAGRHMYAAPAPAGMQAVTVTLDDQPGLVQRGLLRPASETHQLHGTDEQFQVHHGMVELRLPLTVSATPETLTLAGQVRWQCCDDEVCDVPQSHRFALSVPVQPSPPVALGSKAGAALEPNAMAHFQKMTTRRQT